MWNFTEFAAKKAQELQEQANMAASTFSVTSGFTLNLDAMQAETPAPSNNKPVVVEPEATPQIQPLVHNQLDANNSIIAQVQPRPRPVPKGKLQVPKGKQTAMNIATSSNSNDQSADAPFAPSVVSQEEEDVKSAAREVEKVALATNSMDEANKVEDDPDQNNVEDGASQNQPSPSNEASEDRIAEVVELKQEPAETVMSDANDAASEAPSERAAEPLAETESNNSQQQQSTEKSQPTTTEAKQSSPILLVSSADLAFVAGQNAAETELRKRNISYETIDVQDAEAKMMIDDLLCVSGISNEFPQFFLVDLETGVATFWGGYRRFQKAIDDNLLENQMFGHAANADADIPPAVCSKPSPEAPVTEVPSPSASTHLLEQFTLQLKRLEENHQTEMIDIQRRHAREIESIKASINHDECEASRIQLEERLMAQIRDKEERLHDAIQRNEGYQLKLDVLKREVEGTQALLEAKNADMGKFGEENLKQLRSWERKVNEAEAEIEKAKEHSKKLETSLEESKKELSAALEEHESSRERLKALASELKARRAECRELKTSIDAITEEKSKLVLKIENLEFQLSDKDRSGSEKYEEMEKLRSELSVATTECEKLRKVVNEKDSENEKLLSEYKRKTQSALAMANSRTAASVQSKEEAELEARAARSTADSAMERVVQAELKSKAAVAEARATVKDMELQRDEAIRKHEESAAYLAEKDSTIERLQNDLAESRAVAKGKEEELARTLSDLTSEKTRSLSYQKDLADLNSRINLLRDEVKTLREKLRHAESAVSTQAEEPEQTTQRIDTKLSKESIDSSTVAILQQELREANQVIDELKEALQNAVEASGKNTMNGKERDMTASVPDSHQNTNGSNDSIPLFYAMEKQAELNVARNEIARLANLLSNAQAQKMEALDAVEDMRRKMEDAEARLMRFEKLRPSGTRQESAEPGAEANKQPLHDSGAVNIEYLKNIMLRYLNATSLSEKRALVPVVGAVLCLTREEQQKALASLEESVSIGGVGSTLFESLSGKLTTPR